MSSRQRGLRFFSLGVVFALALALLAACADDRPPETIINTEIGKTRAGAELSEQPTATTEAETTVEEEAETPEEAVEEEATAEEEEEEGGASDVNAEELFVSASCGACHTLAAAGASGQMGPSLDGASLEVDAVETQIRNGGGSMPAFEGRLSDEEITALAAFVSENSK